MLALFTEVERVAQESDIPILLAALEREDGDFWTREMFGSILCDFDRPDLLEPLLVALDKSPDHDSDGFVTGLIGLVEMSPEDSSLILRRLQNRKPSGISVESISWLLEFCVDGQR